MPEPVNAEPSVGCCCFKKRPKEAPKVAAVTTTVPDATEAKVPFSADLPKDLNVGKAICVRGVVLPKCSRFAVNLTCGRSPTSDVAFHLNPRLLQRYVVRNHRLNGQWGDEEKTSTANFGFQRSKNFNLNILIGDGVFVVVVDDVFVCSFQFRIPWSKVTGIEVQGCVDVLGVDYKTVRSFPERQVERVAEDRGQIVDTETATPVTFLLPGGLQQQWQLEIYGRVKILPHSFYVNLQKGAQQWPHPNIPLHLNPRFMTASGEPLFVRNAWIDGGWGQEERTPGFQFAPGSPFTMAIRRGSDHFSVWIDGKLAGEFKFRGNVDKIDSVHIEGDVVVLDVVLQKNFGAKAPGS